PPALPADEVRWEMPSIKAQRRTEWLNYFARNLSGSESKARAGGERESWLGTPGQPLQRGFGFAGQTGLRHTLGGSRQVFARLTAADAFQGEDRSQLAHTLDGKRPGRFHRL